MKRNGIVLQGLLEEKFLEYEIEDLESKLEKANLSEIQKKINEIYNNEYIELSKELLLKTLEDTYNKKEYENIYSKIKDSENNSDLKKLKENIINLYPVIMATVDAFLNNFYHLFNTNKKIDCIIIDEASQCDIMSVLPLLYSAEKIIIVGDSKQLSAIINISANSINNKVKEGYDYTKENFLTSIAKKINPVSNMLLEHYRCDYKIINYCNKYFYDNKLIVYKDQRDDSMVLIDNDKGKYVELIEKSFVNYRKILTIDNLIQSVVKGKFIITPFKG